MSGPSGGNDGRFIWATRGNAWGFRFLRRGGYEDPLTVYEGAFAEIGDNAEGWAQSVNGVALRFLDPDGRCDAAGRVIPHDFVLLGSWAEGVDSLEAGRDLVWPEVAEEFRTVWDRPEPPSVAD